MESVQTLHRSFSVVGRVVIIVVVSLLSVAGCKRSRQVMPPDQPTLAPTFSGDPRNATPEEIATYIARLKWRDDITVQLNVGGRNVVVNLASEAGAYLVDVPGLTRGRIVARLIHVSGPAWSAIGLGERQVVYWWLRGTLPANPGPKGTIVEVNGGEALFINLADPSAIWQDSGLLYHFHGERQYPHVDPPSGKFKRLKKTNGRYELVERDRPLDTRLARAVSAPTGAFLAAHDASSLPDVLTAILETEVIVAWEACHMGCCASNGS